MPQLLCKGGTNNCQYEPSEVLCFNEGYGSESVEWTCNADMDDNLELSLNQITCVLNKDKVQVAEGSCSLEYIIDTMDGAVHKGSNVIHRNKTFMNNKIENMTNPIRNGVLPLTLHFITLLFVMSEYCISPMMNA